MIRVDRAGERHGRTPTGFESSLPGDRDPRGFTRATPRRRRTRLSLESEVQTPAKIVETWRQVMGMELDQDRVARQLAALRNMPLEELSQAKLSKLR